MLFMHPRKTDILLCSVELPTCELELAFLSATPNAEVCKYLSKNNFSDTRYKLQSFDFGMDIPQACIYLQCQLKRHYEVLCLLAVILSSITQCEEQLI